MLDPMVLVTAAGSLAATAAAIAAWRATTATRRAAEGQLLSNLLAEYASEQMRDALRLLVAWHGQHGPTKGAMLWMELLGSGDLAARDLDSARRIVSHFFSRIAQLHRAQALSCDSMREICDLSGLGIYFLVNEGLERALSPDYLTWPFHHLKAACLKFGVHHEILVPATRISN
jgi:hypothetical protein